MLKRSVIVLGLVVLGSFLYGQDLKNMLRNKQYEREFYALAFKHKASYRFFKDSVRYSVNGFFVSETYTIVGKYYYDRFVGKDPRSGQRYVLYIKVLSPDKILLSKEGVSPDYKAILANKPVKGWHEYYRKP